MKMAISGAGCSSPVHPGVPHYKPDHLPFSIPHWHGPDIEKMTNDDWIFQLRVALEFFRYHPDHSWAFNPEARARLDTRYYLEIAFCMFLRLAYNVETWSYIATHGSAVKSPDPILAMVNGVNIINWVNRGMVSRKRKLPFCLRRTCPVSELFLKSGLLKNYRLHSREEYTTIPYPIQQYRPARLAQKLKQHLLRGEITSALRLNRRPELPETHPYCPQHYTMFELILNAYLDL